MSLCNYATPSFSFTGLVLRHYHLDQINPDQWVDEEDLPSWVHDDDLNTDHGGRVTPREKRGNAMDDETFTLSEQVDLLGLVKGNILKSKNVRGDSKDTISAFAPSSFCVRMRKILLLTSFSVYDFSQPDFFDAKRL